MHNPMTEEFIRAITDLKTGDLGLIRAMSHKSMDEDMLAFDLFTAIWWPLREKNPRAPKREVAWLIMKLYSAYPIPHQAGAALCSRLREIPGDSPAGKILDYLINLSLDELELPLQDLLRLLKKVNCSSLDWVKLTDDLSGWDFDSVRAGWISDYNHYK